MGTQHTVFHPIPKTSLRLNRLCHTVLLLLSGAALSSKYLLPAYSLSPPQHHWEQGDYQEVIKAGGVAAVIHGTLSYTHPSGTLLMGSGAGGGASQGQEVRTGQA